MGFSKAKTQNTVRIAMLFTHSVSEDGGKTFEDAEIPVIHTYTIPTTAQRERYKREGVAIKGRKVRLHEAVANWNLFCNTIVSVEGYDDIPTPADQTKELLMQYFSDEVCRFHAEEGVRILVERLISDEVFAEKK